VDEDEILNDPIDESQFYRGDRKIPKEDAQFAWTPAMVKEIDKCKKDIVYFAESQFTITNVDRGKEKIKLYVAQKQVLRALANNRFVCLLSSRQAGKSTLMTIYALWMTCFYNDQRVIIVANKEQTAVNIFKRVRMAYEQLPNYIKPGVKEYGKTGVVFANDSSIGISTTTSTAARGESVNCLIVDEMAFIERHFIEEFWKSVIPVISSGKKTKIFVVSTPNGTDNKFYEIYSGAEKGTNGWKSERIDWWDIPGRTERWKKQMISTLGSEEAFQQEFGNVFIDDGNSAIGSAIIERFKQNKKPPIWTSDDNTYKIFESPKQSNLYIIGVDVGEGIRTVNEVSIWEQVALAANMQRWWADNQVSCTVTFNPKTEGNQIANVLDYFQYQLKGISFLPKCEYGAFPQMPYEEISEGKYYQILNNIRPLEFSTKLKQDGEDEKYCDSKSCVLKK
jgi:hypothetical protein